MTTGILIFCVNSIPFVYIVLVKVWIKESGQRNDDAVGVDTTADSIVQTPKEAYLGTKGPSRIAALTSKYDKTELSNRRPYRCYLEDHFTALGNATLIAEDGGKASGQSDQDADKTNTVLYRAVVIDGMGWKRYLARECVEPNPGFGRTMSVAQAKAWLRGLGDEYAVLAKTLEDSSGSTIYRYSKEDLVGFLLGKTPEDKTTGFWNLVHPRGCWHSGGRGWKRDLTMECVEPNPGPEMKVVFDQIAETRFPTMKDQVRQFLGKIEVEILKTPPGIFGHTEEHIKAFFISKPITELAAIVGEEAATILDKEVRAHLGLPSGVNIQTIEEGCMELGPPATDVPLCFFSEFKEHLYKLWNLHLPTVSRPSVFKGKPAVLADNLPTVIGNPGVLDLRLMRGHLSDQEANSPVVAQIVGFFLLDVATGKRSGIRLRGPSGSGKTKAIFDILAKFYGIYIDWSATQPKDIACFAGRVGDYARSRVKTSEGQSEFEDKCSYELCLLYTARFMVLMLLMEKGVVTCPVDWLYLQLNGLVVGYYKELLGPVRNYLRKAKPELGMLQQLLGAMVSVFPNLTHQKAPGVIALDEINMLVKRNDKLFLSMTTAAVERPLISLVIRETYKLSGPEVIASGTSKVQDHQDYFESLVGKGGKDLPRKPEDVHMRCLKPKESLNLLNRLIKSPHPLLKLAILRDGTRARFMTAFADCLAEGEFAGEKIEHKGDLLTTWRQYRKVHIEGASKSFNSELAQVTLYSSVDQFAVHLGADKLATLVLQGIEGAGEFLLTDEDANFYASNLTFLSKSDKKFKFAEPMVHESILHYLKKHGPSLSRMLVTQMTQGSLSAKELGLKLEAVIALHLGSGEARLRLPQLEFTIPTRCFDFVGRTTISEWMQYRNIILRAKDSARIDVLFPLLLEIGALSQLFPKAPNREWVCCGIIACKSTQKEGEAVPKAEVKSAVFTSEFANCYAQVDGKSHNNKMAALQSLHTLQQESNVLFVRLLVNFPNPTKNFDTTDLPDPFVIERKEITVTLGEKTMIYYELVVAVDLVNARKIGLIPTDSIYDSLWNVKANWIKQTGAVQNQNHTFSYTTEPRYSDEVTKETKKFAIYPNPPSAPATASAAKKRK